jgi:limonene-1,2-epoxide hydrolase
MEDEAEASERWEVDAPTARDAVNGAAMHMRFHPHHVEARRIEGRPGLSSTAGSSNNEQIIRDFIAAWSRLNVDEIVSYFAEDGVYHNIPVQPVQGHKALRNFISGFISNWSSTEWDLINLTSRNDVVIAERLDRTVTGGKQIDLPCCGVFEMSNGKIREWRDYFDMATYIKALSK